MINNNQCVLALIVVIGSFKLTMKCFTEILGYIEHFYTTVRNVLGELSNSFNLALYLVLKPKEVVSLPVCFLIIYAQFSYNRSLHGMHPKNCKHKFAMGILSVRFVM